MTETPSFTPVVVLRAKDFHPMIGPGVCEGGLRLNTSSLKSGEHLLSLLRRVLSRVAGKRFTFLTESLVVDTRHLPAWPELRRRKKQIHRILPQDQTDAARVSLVSSVAHGSSLSVHEGIFFLR